MTVDWLRTRESFEREERERLAPCAVLSAESAGRQVAETPHPYRTDFQRDRDRVVHARAFRRLEYKTQVFVFHEGDHYRNRLTHTLEGAQIARTIARVLRLNEDLAEAIALTHDLGHTPFGHAGERVLALLLADEGGFDHNRQSLRVVDWLEDRYPRFRGLNLTSETREGVLKHGCTWEHPVPIPPLYAQRSLEGQVADLADEIAYVNHDLDDGLSSGILEFGMLDEFELWTAACAASEPGLAELGDSMRRSQVVIALINGLVQNVIEACGRRLAEQRPGSVDEVRGYPDALVRFTDDVEKQKLQLKRFLFENFYNHPRVLTMTNQAEAVIGDLYRAYRKNLSLLPTDVRARLNEEPEARVTADYIAGMTDRFAMAEHEKLGKAGV